MKIKPDSIQLNTLDHSGTISGLRGATREELQQVSDYWELNNVEIIAAPPQRKDLPSYRNDVETAILETKARRLARLDVLTKILGMHVNEVNKYLDVLEGEEKIETVARKEVFFIK